MTREELIAALEKAAQDTGFHYGRVSKAALDRIKKLEKTVEEMGNPKYSTPCERCKAIYRNYDRTQE